MKNKLRMLFQKIWLLVTFLFSDRFVHKLIWINTLLLLFIIAAFIVKEKGFSWKRFIRYQVSLMPFSQVKMPIKNLAQEEILRFAVISDAHVGSSANSGSLLRNAMEKANKNDAQFAVVLGDLTDHGKLEEFKEVKNILDKSGLKSYTVPGNHDAWLNGIKHYEALFGNRYQRIEIPLNPSLNNTYFNRVVLYTLDTTGSEAVDKFMDQKQMDWVSEYMKNGVTANGAITFVFQESNLPRLPAEHRMILTNRYCRQRVTALFFANSHLVERNYQACNIIDQDSGSIYEYIQSLNSGSINRNKMLPGILLIHVFSDGQMEAERILLDEKLE